MEAPAAEVDCLAVLDFWGLVCRVQYGHVGPHYGHNDATGRAGYWGHGIVHVERAVLLTSV